MKPVALIFFAALAVVMTFLFVFYLAWRAYICSIKICDWLGGFKSLAFFLFPFSFFLSAAAQSLPWMDDLMQPVPTVAAVQTAAMRRTGPVPPRHLALSWTNSLLEAGIELLITTNNTLGVPPSGGSGPWTVDTNLFGDSAVLTNLPWWRIYLFSCALPNTNYPYLVESPPQYQGSFSGFEYLPVLEQSNNIIKWLTNEPDGPYHFYQGPGLSATIVPVAQP